MKCAEKSISCQASRITNQLRSSLKAEPKHCGQFWGADFRKDRGGSRFVMAVPRCGCLRNISDVKKETVMDRKAFLERSKRNSLGKTFLYGKGLFPPSAPSSRVIRSGPAGRVDRRKMLWRYCFIELSRVWVATKESISAFTAARSL